MLLSVCPLLLSHPGLGLAMAELVYILFNITVVSLLVVGRARFSFIVERLEKTHFDPRLRLQDHALFIIFSIIFSHIWRSISSITARIFSLRS